MKYRVLLLAVLVEKGLASGQMLPPVQGTSDRIGCEARWYTPGLKSQRPSLARDDIDVTYYRLALTITTSPNYVRGCVTVKAVSKVDQLSNITLDLMNAMTVDSVKVGNNPAQFIQHPTAVSIELNRSYGVGEMAVLDVFYRGTPVGTGFGSFAFGSHAGTPWVWTLSEPYGARDWWPCVDHPRDKADSVDIVVTCRNTFRVASNGRLIGIVPNADSTHTYTWSSRYPIATYLVFISLTNYAEFTEWFRYSPTDSMPVVNYVLPEHLSAARDSFSKTITMLQVFSDKFGSYPFINEKYGHAEFGLGGAMEHQTMTSLVRSAFGEYVLAHELGHHWFGNLITCASWQHLWLNEGFASYCEAVYAEAMYGQEAYREKIGETMQTAKSAVGSVFKTDTTNLPVLFDQRTVYRKGASILHMLRYVLGDSTFFRCIRRYVEDTRFRFKSATTADFQDVCESASGRSLSWFFDQWVYGENHPQYSFTWSGRQAAGTYAVTIHLSQTTRTNTPAFFIMPVQFTLSAAGWDTSVTLFNDTNPQEFNFATSRNPTTVTLDPENRILRDILPASMLPEAFRLKQNFPNPFNARTTIEYELARAARVSLTVHNLLGEHVTTLVDAFQYPGQHRAVFEAADVPTGVYFYRLRTTGFTQTRKCLIIR